MQSNIQKTKDKGRRTLLKRRAMSVLPTFSVLLKVGNLSKIERQIWKSLVGNTATFLEVPISSYS